MLTQTGLTVPERPKAYGSSQEQSATTILWTKLPQNSWLCPKGHHSNSPQQHSDGPFWHNQVWMWQEDLSPMGHHTDSPQQQSNGAIWTKADCALWVITRTVRNNNPMDQFDPKSWLCLWVIMQTVHNNILMDHVDTNRIDCARKT